MKKIANVLRRTAIFISILIVVFLVFINQLTKLIINYKVSKLNYISYEKLSVDVLNNYLSVEGLNYNAKNKIISLKAKEIVINNISIYSLFKNHINISNLTIDSALVTLTPKQQNYKSPNLFNQLNINKLTITNSDLNCKIDNFKKAHFKAINASFDSLYLDTRQDIAQYGLSNCKGELSSILLQSETEKINTSNIKIDNKDKIVFSEVSILSNKLPVSKNYYYFDSIQVNYNNNKLLKEKTLEIMKVNFSAFKLISDYYKTQDKRQEKEKLMAISFIKSIPYTFAIDSLSISNGAIDYNEFRSNLTDPLTVQFYDLNAVITNITNDSIKINNLDQMKITAKSRFLGETKINVDIRFDLKSDNEYHVVKGKIGSLKLLSLNPTIRELALIEFTNGQLNYCDFNFTADIYRSIGKANFNYSGIRINTFNKEEKQLKENGFLVNFASNTFLIRNNNPINNNFKVGKIETERIPEKSIFNYWWRSLFTGLESTIIKVPIHSNN